jgi:formylglycine-generating enzyme required for sulfatase activity
MKSAVSRGDLIRIYRELGLDGLEQSASALGYYRRGKTQVRPKPVPLVTPLPSSGPKSTPQIEHRFDSREPEAFFWRMVRFQEITQVEGRGGEPEWLKEEREISESDEEGDFSRPLPPRVPLVHWSRLWPFLFAALGRQCDSRTVDLDRTLHLIAHARPIKRLPYVQRLTWAGRGQLILDVHETTMPFWDDCSDLLRRITAFRGISGLEVLVFENTPDEGCRAWVPGKETGESKPYALPVPGAPVLVLSDLGCLDREGGCKQSWLRLGKRLKNAGFKPVALMPCPPRLWDPELETCWTMVSWDRGPVPGNPSRARRLNHFPVAGNREKGVELSMAMLGAAVRVEPALLRAMRLLLPHMEADVGTEAMIWQHDDVHPSPLALGFKPEKSGDYRGLFYGLPAGKRELAVQLIKKYHAHLPGSIRAEEEIIACGPEGEGCVDRDTGGGRYMRRVLKTGVNRGFPKGLGSWVDRLFERGQKNQFVACEVLNPLWFIRNREAWEQGRAVVPEGIDFQQAAWVLGKGKPVHLELAQLGMTFTAGGEGGSPLLSLVAENGWLAVAVRAETGEQRYFYNLEKENNVTFPVPLEGRVTLDVEGAQVELETFRKPEWADAIGRDWQGLYADFNVKGVVQRMRWITPGKFMMGSPEHEKERRESETLHEVILTDGFWMADTACTQALWQAVMGKNPSKFKGQERPVERVSWEDSQIFIDNIKLLKPGFDLSLPTEAQWEYACRAGTDTAFWFGDNITPDQVNYDGDNPYAGGEKGAYREKTVDVKSLPYNGWGLYQMHGNVWEWCEDWYDDYSPDAIVNPTGPDVSENRVCRGGGWDGSGGDVRSAIRAWDHPSFRDSFLGFRLAQVIKGVGGTPHEGSRQVTGRSDAAERNR